MLKRKKLLITGILLLFVVTGMVSLPIIYSVSSRLSKTNRVEANVLIVEGWLPPYAIELAYDEYIRNSYDHVITTGIRISGYYEVSMNGYLIFYTRDILKSSDKTGNHIIEIEAFGEADETECAHFNVFVNDSVVADFFADEVKRKYSTRWNGRLTDIDSVTVQFDNDRHTDSGDINLYVKEIIIDNKINIAYQYNSEYDIGEIDGKKRLINNFGSHAELARNKLISLGLDSSLVLAVPGENVWINRTLSSALAYRDWLETSEIEVKGINIVTMGTHARRTWMTYNKILDKKYQIGIISLPDYREHHSKKYKVLKTLRESLGLLYYWFLLLPY
jgi:hypothetical protein